MHYSLYIPKVTNPDPQHLARVGLGDLLQPDQPAPMFAEIMNNGPDGGHGLYVYWRNSAQHYRPGELSWHRAKPFPAKQLEAGRFHWGYDHTNPITANDLIRPATLRGEIFEAGNHAWLIPNVLLLPSRFILDDEGHQAREVTTRTSKS